MKVLLIIAALGLCFWSYTLIEKNFFDNTANYYGFGGIKNGNTLYEVQRKGINHIEIPFQFIEYDTVTKQIVKPMRIYSVHYNRGYTKTDSGIVIKYTLKAVYERQ